MTEPAAFGPLEVALLVAAAIQAVGGHYFVGGSFASSMQGEPRATNDIDFVIELPLGRIHDFRATLGSDFEVDVDMLRDAIRSASTANAFHLPTVTKVDFFGRAYEDYDESEFSRRRAIVVGEPDQTLFIKAPEDTVLRKLLWYRAGGEVSDRQWRDVVSVLRVSGAEMDLRYLQIWAPRLGLASLLARAREQAE